MTLFWCAVCRQLHGEWDVEYTGTGEYEGLTYREHVEHPFDGPVILTGTIKGIRHR